MTNKQPDVISFTAVHLPYGWLGNMSPHPIRYGEHVYRTPEALFQSMRFTDPEIQELIRAERTPMGAKFMAKRHYSRMAVERQSAQDLDNMRLVLWMKVDQHPDRKAALLATGAARIIEDCTRRTRGSGKFWGAEHLKSGEWDGDNWLGKLWMELRKRLSEGR